MMNVNQYTNPVPALPMKKLLLIGLSFTLLVVGCENPTEPLPPDCAGVAGGTAVLSGCDNLCNSTAVVDCVSGVCSNSPENVELWSVCYSIANTTQLVMYIAGLTGEIPSEIGSLTNLTYLNLGHNDLTGEIPVEIGQLTNLTYLILYENQLTGSIPSEIGNLTNLTQLYLSSNEFTGEIPSEIWEMTNLTSLILSANQLTGEIPEEICNLWGTSLTFLNLWNNSFCPPYPECLDGGASGQIGYQDTSECEEPVNATTIMGTTGD